MIKGLYVITAEVQDRSHVDVAGSALKAGAKTIQYREKDKLFEDMVSDCFLIKELCQEYDADFIVNDFTDLALAVEADGVHVGQDDEKVIEAKEKLESKIIGLSVSNLEQAIHANSLDVDYLGVGPIFPTPTKEDAAPPIGLEGLKAIRKATRLPLIAIGGISVTNARQVYEAGADGLAVISAIALSDDINRAVKEMLEISEPFTKH